VDDGSTADAARADFYMADLLVNHELPSGDNLGAAITGELTMNDLLTSQDGCRGARLLLNLTA
jgi:hypothetical protein